MSRETPDPEELLAHASWAQRVARDVVRDTHQAEDLAQDAVEARLKHGGRIEHERGWFAGVARRLSLQSLRSQSRRQRREATARRADGPPTPDTTAEKLEAHRLLAELVLKLPEKQRAALVLRYYDELPISEVARRLAIHPKAAESRIYRGLEELRSRMRHRYGENWASVLVPLGPGVLQPALTTAVIAMSTTSKLTIAAGVILAAATISIAFSSGFGASEKDLPQDGASLVQGQPLDSIDSLGTKPDEGITRGPSLATERRRTLLLKVTDETGKAIPHSEVEAYWTPGETDHSPGSYLYASPLDAVGSAPDLSVTADEGGNARIAVPAGLDSAALFAGAEGYMRACATWVLKGEETESDLGAVVLRPGATVVVDVRDPDGAPVADALVRAFSHLGGIPAGVPRFLAAVSDSEGRAHLRGAVPGPTRVNVSHAHYATHAGEALETLAGRQHHLVVALEKGGTAEIEVRRADGSPAAGAEIYVAENGTQLPLSRLRPVPPDFAGYLPENGNFVAEGIPDGGYVSIIARLDGSWIEGERVRAGEERTLTLPAPRSFTGQVLWPDGTPAAGTRVRMLDAVRRCQYPELEIETDFNGQFQATLPEGPYGVSLWHPLGNRIFRDATAISGNTDLLTLELSRTGLLVFNCVDARTGAPVPAPWVTVRNDTREIRLTSNPWVDQALHKLPFLGAVKKEEGEVRIRTWAERRLTIELRPLGYLMKSLSFDPQEDDAGLRTLKFDPACKLTLTVLDQDGVPEAGRTISLAPEGFDPLWMTREESSPPAVTPTNNITDADGIVSWPSLAPGRWVVGDGFGEADRGNGFAEIAIAAGANEMTVRLPVRPRLQVTVSLDGAPVAGAAVIMEAAVDKVGRAGQAIFPRDHGRRTGIDGRVAVESAQPAGSYLVAIFKEGLFPVIQEVSLSAEQESLEVALNTGSIVGTVTNPGPKARVLVLPARSDATNAKPPSLDRYLDTPKGYVSTQNRSYTSVPVSESGGYSVVGLAPGPYWIAAFGDMRLPSLPVLVQIGENVPPATADFRLNPGGAVVLKVTGVAAFRELHPDEVPDAVIRIAGKDYDDKAFRFETDGDYTFAPLPCVEGEIVLMAYTTSSSRVLERIPVEPRPGERIEVEWDAAEEGRD